MGLPVTPRLWFYRLGARRFDRDAAVRELAIKTNEFEQQSQQLTNQPSALKKVNRRFAREAKRLRQEIEEGNWVMRNLGEPPSYFTEQDARTNTAKMQRFLMDKGFFNARTAYSLDTLRNQQIRVRYLITENAGFYLRNLTYEIDDARIDSLIRKSLNQSTLIAGERYDSQKIGEEKVRIETALRDQGYYAFSRQYMPNPEVDTSRRSSERLLTVDSLRRPVDLYLTIKNPPGQAAHPLYRIGDVEVRITADETQSPAAVSALDSVRRNGVTFLLSGRNISSRLLDGKIFLRPGQLYSQTKYRDTQRQLFLLNQFKFVNLNFTDTTNRQLRTLVTATPLDKYEATAEGGVTLLYQGQGYPGGFGSLIFRVRNLFGGLETFETTLRYGLEAQTGFVNSANSNKFVYTSQELGIISSITFPQLLFPGRLRFNFNRYNPRTQVSLSFNNTFRPDFRRSLLRATMAYNWQTTPAKQFSFLIADVNLINANFDTELGNLFLAQLDSLTTLGNTIGLSFRRSFASGVSFAYTYNTNTIGQNRRANFFRTVIESGGTTLNLFSEKQLQNIFKPTINNTGLQYYKYLRLSLDYRHYVPLRTHTTVAFRMNTGIVYSYGGNRTAPYEKLFFAGGSNSIRAWLPRRLGPGSDYPQPSPTNPNGPAFNLNPARSEQFLYTFEKPGDFLLEGSAELRGRLFHLLADINGAVFIDAGNVWRLPYSQANTKSTFQFGTFIPQIAVGTGVGLRLDFSFFLIRLDGGIKVWDPARQYFSEAEGQYVDKRFILPDFSFRRLSRGPNPLIINFGIGYPF